MSFRKSFWEAVPYEENNTYFPPGAASFMWTILLLK